MKNINTFLTFNNQAEEALNLYTAVFKNSKILNIFRMPDGAFMTATFQINGQEFMALNGGPHFTFAEGMSLFVSCDTQQEVDDLWGKLSAGGEKQQ